MVPTLSQHRDWCMKILKSRERTKYLSKRCSIWIGIAGLSIPLWSSKKIKRSRDLHPQSPWIEVSEWNSSFKLIKRMLYITLLIYSYHFTYRCFWKNWQPSKRHTHWANWKSRAKKIKNWYRGLNGTGADSSRIITSSNYPRKKTTPSYWFNPCSSRIITMRTQEILQTSWGLRHRNHMYLKTEAWLLCIHKMLKIKS